MRERIKSKYSGWLVVTLMGLLATFALPVHDLQAQSATPVVAKAGATASAGLEMNSGTALAVHTTRIYTIEARRCSDGIWESSTDAAVQAQIDAARADGHAYNCWTVWEASNHNLTTTAGLNDLLDKYFKGSSYTAAHYCGLVDNAGFSAYAAGDTMGSHAGWAESTAYSNANRPTITLGTVSAGSVDNSASKCVFNINGTATIRGSFVTTNNTKGGTTGTLYGEADYSASRSVINGDTLNVTVTLTAS